LYLENYSFFKLIFKFNPEVMIGTYIDLREWREDTYAVTHSVWYYPKSNMGVKQVLATFCSINGLPQPDGGGLPYNMLMDTREAFQRYLKSNGWKQVSMKPVSFSD
jgi:hypothetical protein